MMRAILVACLLCLSVAAFAGQPDAYSAGMAAYQAKDYATALADFKRAAQQGVARAQTILGVMYYEGQGVPQNYVEAAKWSRLAAKQGVLSAQNNLGVTYQDGQGVPQNYTKALKWYRLAAAHGFARAQNNVGFMYDYGRGVQQDFVKAYKWFAIAKASGANNERRRLSELAALLTPAQIAQAQQEASAWWAAHHKGGN